MLPVVKKKNCNFVKSKSKNAKSPYPDSNPIPANGVSGGVGTGEDTKEKKEQVLGPYHVNFAGLLDTDAPIDLHLKAEFYSHSF